MKSLRRGRCHLKDAYVSFKGEEAFLQKAHISPYEQALNGGHEPERLRKLLLKKEELKRIKGLTQKKKNDLCPLKHLFLKGKSQSGDCTGSREKPKGQKRISKAKGSRPTNKKSFKKNQKRSNLIFSWFFITG